MMTSKITKSRILFFKLKMFAMLYFTSTFDFVFYCLFIPAIKANYLSSSKKSIVYLGGNMPARIARIVKWHKRFEDYISILLCHKDGFRDKYSNPSIDHVVLFRNSWHLKRILRELKSVNLIHAFGPKSFYPAVALKYSTIPFVYDMQDVLVTYYGLHPSIRWFKHELPYEKYCLGHADGFVSHSLEFQEGIRQYQIPKRDENASNLNAEYKPRNIFFPLCCDDDVQKIKKGKFNPEEIHIVYVGEVAGSFRDSKQFATIQFHYIIEEFRKQKIHLHLYAAPGTMSDDINEYKSIASKNPYVHMHESVHQSELANELSQYDFGLIPFFFKDTIHHWEKFKLSTSLKLFNYVEAGLPVISTEDIVFQSWIVERYGMGLIINKSDIPILGQIIKENNYQQLLSNIDKNRLAISLSKHIPRLLKFYDDIINKKQNTNA